MKEIIIGQLMMWANIVSVIIGYLLITNFPAQFGQYVQVVCGGIGVIGSGANLFFSIATQVEGYQKLKILSRN